jgi:hypothetical protein
MLKQPLKEPLKQQGIYHNTSEEELWDGDADDIRLDLPEDVRRKIAIELTRISKIGFAENNEFASLIELDTGDVVYGLKKGVKKGNDDIEINIDSWTPFLTKSNKNSLLIVHNHPNKSIHSSDDIEIFYKYNSVNCLWVISGDKIFNLQRTENTIEGITVFRETVEKFKPRFNEFTVEGKTYNEKLYYFLQKVFSEINVIFERW